MFKKIFILSMLLFLPVYANAAVLYLDPAEGEYGPGDSFAADIRIEIGNDCINTVEAFVNFPNDYLSVIDFITGESILSLWVEKPDKAGLKEVNRTGTLHFAGGIPGGYCGKIPGDPGESDILGRIVFQMPGMIVSDVERERVEIGFSPASRVLLNDGLGTADAISTRGASFKVSKKTTSPDEAWREELRSDIIPPNPFVIELRSDPGIFDGRYYIIFSTVDKQTGVDHFEVLEITPEELAGIEKKQSLYERLFAEVPKPADWKPAKTPHLLANQDLTSIIRVKAIDKAGNERIEEYIPPESMQKPVSKSMSTGELIFWSALGLFALMILAAIIAIIIKIIKRIKRSKNYEKNNL